jgi:hypothetical protein
MITSLHIFPNASFIIILSYIIMQLRKCQMNETLVTENCLACKECLSEDLHPNYMLPFSKTGFLFTLTVWSEPHERKFPLAWLQLRPPSSPTMIFLQAVD